MKYPSKNTSESKTLTDGSACHATSAQSSPRVVIRGESILNPPPATKSKKIAFIDYLSFTHSANEIPAGKIPLEGVIHQIFGIPRSFFRYSDRGWNGYETKVDLNGCGLIAYGGSSQRETIHVQITGQGCARVPDWFEVFLWGSQTNTKITRIDFAHDDLNGEVVNIKNALRWLDEGLFNSSGRPPRPRMIDDFDTGTGKTLYIGQRKNGKMLRVYEKGRQMGDPLSPWCRAEVEYRSKDRRIAWDSVLHPDEYLAGSYDAFNFLSETQSRIKTLSKAKAISLESAIEYCRTAYGQLINYLAEEQGMEPERIILLLSRDGIPQKLRAYVS